MSEALLELKNLDVTYSTGTGEVAAVRNVNLRLEAGDTLGVAGESGSGKSTVAMSVLRLLPRSARVSGAVLLDGEDVTLERKRVPDMPTELLTLFDRSELTKYMTTDELKAVAEDGA